MGKLILCSGERTSRPYGFVGIRVYSIEELCYFLFHHVYLIEENLLSEELFDWIGQELGLTERADRLKLLKRQKADLKTLVTVILCSSDYYTENEIKGMLKILDNIIGMPMLKRNCLKADQCLKNGQYREAAAEYEKIIISGETSQLTPVEYGDLLHNLAVAKVHITGLKEAAKLFAKAYECNHREESLRQYLCTLQLSGSEMGNQNPVIEFEISEELQNNVLNFLMQLEEEVGYSQDMLEIEQLTRYKALGKMPEYYEKANEMIDSWKANIRQI